jgi:TPP-dependent pyruvate/acetoin dehydrogenase alpha subunit
LSAWTVESLQAFEADIAEAFNAGLIRAPVHLAGGNEAQLIEAFKTVQPADWILGSWRSHYHCLLRGVPAERVKAAILDGRSIALTFPEHRVLCSAIVGAIAPIGVGLAMGIKRRRENHRVHVFLGDMSAECGIVHESIKYAHGHNLPIRWIVEDNGLSVGTNTFKAWGTSTMPELVRAGLVEHYGYTLTHGHVGTGKWVPF